MAITKLEQDTVSIGLQTAKKLIDELKPVLDKLNALYDAEGGVKATLTQGEMDSITSWQGLTKQQLDDGMYAMTSVARGGIINAYNALVEMGFRA